MDIKETRITKSVLVLQDSTENWTVRHCFVDNFVSNFCHYGFSWVAKVLWTLCYASPEEIPELQRPCRATRNRRNLQCEDDSIMWANATRDTGSPCLGAAEASVWRVGLAGCRFLCAAKYLALLTEHEWSGPQHPAQGGVTFPGILFLT